MSKVEARTKPKLAISVGESSGVGPEVCLRALMDTRVVERCVPLVFGPEKILRQIGKKLNLPCPDAIVASDINQRQTAGIIDVGDLEAHDVRAGSINQHTGKASYDAVVQATTCVRTGKAAALVTGPIQKEAWHAAEVPFPGHTELLADLTNTGEFCMMLTSDRISCVLATIHIPLADVPKTLSTEGILRAITLGADALHRKLGYQPKVSVCGLNPHAGESGMFSHGEEQNIILPAIEQARTRGIQVSGPLPPDTAFTENMRSETDVYVCMYHDQGLIPLKTLSFDDAVNVTLGLPMVRTSVDHGTALDIAWQGVASHQSMLSAINLALDLV